MVPRGRMISAPVWIRRTDRRDDHRSSAIHLRRSSDKRTSNARPYGVKYHLLLQGFDRIELLSAGFDGGFAADDADAGISD